MMVLEVCHALFSSKMDDTAIKLEALELSAFPGEKINKFANEAQLLIKIMKDRYAFPYQLGSKIVTKLYTTQSLYFNRNIFNVLDKVLAMENAHGPHHDPKLLKSSSDYV